MWKNGDRENGMPANPILEQDQKNALSSQNPSREGVEKKKTKCRRHTSQGEVLQKQQSLLGMSFNHQA